MQCASWCKHNTVGSHIVRHRRHSTKRLHVVLRGISSRQNLEHDKNSSSPYGGCCVEVKQQEMKMMMGRVALVIATLTALATPAFAQKAQVDAANAKWMELFNKGDFDGVGGLYT